MRVIYHMAVLLAFLIIASAGIAIMASGNASVTANMVKVKSIAEKMPAAYTYFIAGLFTVGIIFNLSYMRLANTHEAKMRRFISKTKKHMKRGEHEKATALYEEARLQYSRLSSVDKMRHYDSVMNIYNELLAHTRAQEAKELAEKYAAGEITKEELQRFEVILRGY